MARGKRPSSRRTVERRHHRMHELPAEVQAEARRRLDDGSTLDDVTAWLESAHGFVLGRSSVDQQSVPWCKSARGTRLSSGRFAATPVAGRSLDLGAAR